MSSDRCTAEACNYGRGIRHVGEGCVSAAAPSLWTGARLCGPVSVAPSLWPGHRANNTARVVVDN
jgi:hypothetical protein